MAADERKRDELMECQAIELVRVELLAYSSKLPESAVQRLIALLNKGSICQLDPTDVLGTFSHFHILLFLLRFSLFRYYQWL